ncbi:MAG: dephospho-CoA kinase [Acidimicrobiales bacterium]
MFALGLTGGIGSGKSAVADLLVGRGAVLVDADVLARQVVAPGEPAFDALVARFGPGVVAGDGTIDRPGLAGLAFADPAALADLNAITHPAIGAAMVERRDALTGTGAVVVLAVPLLTAAHRATLGLDAVAVVDCPVEVAVERLVAQRHMDRGDAEARVAAQVSRPERLEVADVVVDNSSTRSHLEGEVDRLWAWVAARRRAAPGSGGA